MSRRGERLIWSPREVINRVIHSDSPYGDTREVYMTALEIFFGVIFNAIMILFAYVGCHIAEEKRKGKYIPLFWEKMRD